MSKGSFVDIVLPVARYQDAAQPAAAHAVRPHSIAGRRVLLLPSEKASSPPFTAALAQRLAAGAGVADAFVRQPDWAFFHPGRAGGIGAEIDRYAAECDLMVTGVAY
jgi:hypothetical protein